MANGPAVSIGELRIALPPGGERPFAVDKVSFDLNPGEIVCVVGESGPGKSMCPHPLMGLFPDSVPFDPEPSASRDRTFSPWMKPTGATCAAAALRWCSRSR